MFEAAKIEGCTAWESFWKITLPMVSSMILVNIVYTVIDFFLKTDNTVMDRIDAIGIGGRVGDGVGIFPMCNCCVGYCFVDYF